MTWQIHAQYDNDPKRNGKRRLIRDHTPEGESHVVCSGIKPADARLIAEAPAMLEALREIRNRGYMFDHDAPLWSQVNAILSRIEGEAQS